MNLAAIANTSAGARLEHAVSRMVLRGLLNFHAGSGSGGAAFFRPDSKVVRTRIDRRMWEKEAKLDVIVFF